MSEFRISEAQYRKFRVRFLAISIPISVLIVAGILVAVLFHSSRKLPISLITNLGLLAFLAGVFVVVIYKSLLNMHRWMMNYSLTISANGVSQEYDAAPLSVSSTAIKEIRKNQSGGFQVSGQTTSSGQTVIIGIPRWVDDMSKVEEQLRALAPITTNPKADRRDRLQVFCVVAAFGLFFICLLWSPYKIAEAVKGIFIIGFFGWWLYLFRATDKHPTQGARMMSRIVIFLMVSNLLLTIAKLILF
jgi:hypothetical protein